MLANVSLMPHARRMSTWGKIVLQGPEATLEQTVYAQPALLIADLVAVEKLRAANPVAIERFVVRVTR